MQVQENLFSVVSQCPQLTEEQSKRVVLLPCSLHKLPFNALLGTKHQLRIFILIISLGTLKKRPPELFPEPGAAVGTAGSETFPLGVGAASVHVQKWVVTPVLWRDCGVRGTPGAAQPQPSPPSRVLWAPKGLECLHGLQQQLCHPGNDPALGQTRTCVC